ncbi:LysE family translocator [Saccharopolyspora dendranthemae]|uniref:Threonine/homoserine/homoserine lactone efflux protein n=1 Tax=Saccharopolyspora dendranthemae TaxID=1181886 RepID=A0A561U2J6_9PSEU|nr:LysE family translocator [Saccharopolyspora dendranthemae]TWF93591.1 threonine/homoserine/homoserine lactone efflux protein [Saccharopolyspora dendranthemae]
MTSAALWGFTIVAVLGVMTPGLDTMLVLRHALLGGRRAGFTAVLGITTGCLVWGAAGIVGLTALLTASELAYTAVRVLGAAYLIWLGASALWKTLPRNRKAETPTKDAPAGRSAFRAGLMTNLLNPKVGVFYMSLLPQFLPTGPDASAWGALLVAIHLAAGLVWLPALVWTAGRARAFFQRERVRRWMDRLTATVLLGLGAKLAAEA